MRLQPVRKSHCLSGEPSGISSRLSPLPAAYPIAPKSFRHRFLHGRFPGLVFVAFATDAILALHLARIRDMRQCASGLGDEPQDLALAAHSNQERERLAARLAPREEAPRVSIPRPKKDLWRRLALWLLLGTAAGLLCWFLSRWLRN
jgi:hypothetical protein